MDFANPYVLIALLAFAGISATVDKVKAPVKAAVVKIEHGAKHVLTLGRK